MNDDSLRNTFHQQLADWLELRLHETIGWGSGNRLYGLTVLDREALGRNADEAVRVAFLAEGDVYSILEGPIALAATMFDATGLCCFGTATHLDTGERRRCRTVLVANEDGQATTNRLLGGPPESMGRASGPVATIVDGLYDVIRSTEARPAT
jgi:hypothetical protein